MSDKGGFLGLHRHQSGLASIVVAGLIVVLVGVISLGFALIASRAVKNSRNSQAGSAASYAAQSGVNDAISYLKQHSNDTVSNCSQLLNTDPFSKSLGAGTKYTCVLIYPSNGSSGPTSLSYTSLGPNKSQVSKLTNNGTLANLMVSWQASDGLSSYLPAGQAGSLPDETSWKSSNYAPLLRLSLYPIGAGDNLAPARANARTYYVEPINKGPSPNDKLATIDYADPSKNGSVISAPCGLSSINTSGFTDADYGCNLVINNLASASASYFYARLTPLYKQANLRLEATDGSAPTPKRLQFTNSQSIVDVTASAGNTVKRLQARVSSSGGSSSQVTDSFPEYAISSAATLCKRVQLVNGTAEIEAASADADHCNLSLTAQQYNLSVNVVGNGKVTSNDAKIDCGSTCLATYASPTSVTLTAAPNAGASFASWSGACSGSQTTCTLTVDASKAVTATFNDQNTLTVSYSGYGIVSAPAIKCGKTLFPNKTYTDCTQSYTTPTDVTLSEAPGFDYKFYGWYGSNNKVLPACSKATPACKVHVQGNVAVRAVFSFIIGSSSCSENCDQPSTSSSGNPPSGGGGSGSGSSSSPSSSPSGPCVNVNPDGFRLFASFGNFMIIPHFFAGALGETSQTSGPCMTSSAGCNSGSIFSGTYQGCLGPPGGSQPSGGGQTGGGTSQGGSGSSSSSSSSSSSTSSSSSSGSVPTTSNSSGCSIKPGSWPFARFDIWTIIPWFFGKSVCN